MKRPTLGFLATCAFASASALASACASTQAWSPPSTQDSRDDPASVRPGFGNTDLHTWWPLTAPEVAALQGLGRARQGDAQALLALAILASGDQRDGASYSSHQRRLQQFMLEVKPSVEGAVDDWHRGYAVNRAMHRVFFKGETELGGYQIDQPRVTSIFTTGRYNCLSSAMLFAVLARGFGLPVRAAMVPTHVFIEMGTPGGKIIEVETTSAKGFDWVHDEKFYSEEAAQWSSRRGLRPTTLQEYQQRVIVEPYQLVARAMGEPQVGESEADRSRRNELASIIDPDDPELRATRMTAYAAEAQALRESKAWRTVVKLFDTVKPAVAEIAAKSGDAKTRELLSWASWFYADALMIVSRQDEAMAIVSDGLAHIDASWPDAAKLNNNYLAVLNDRLGELMARHEFEAAVKVFTDHRAPCRAHPHCASSAGIVYRNWSIAHQNAGDWHAARQALQQCVAELPDQAPCREDLQELESRHRF